MLLSIITSWNSNCWHRWPSAGR